MPYIVNTGMNYISTKTKEEVRRESGEVVDDIPSKSLKWLLADGHISEQVAEQTQAEQPAPQPVVEEPAPAEEAK